MRHFKSGFRGTNIFDSEEMMEKAFPTKKVEAPLKENKIISISIFSLTKENLQNVGCPMGSESSTIDWTKYFTTVELAKEYAWEDFSKGRSLAKPFKWIETKNYKHHSEDLGFCMYYIEPVNIER